MMIRRTLWWGIHGFICLGHLSATPSAATDSDISWRSSLPPQYRPRQRRSLQESPNQSCFRKVSEVFFYLSTGVLANPGASSPQEYPIWFPMDFVEECMSSILVNGTNMVDHLKSVRTVFQQYSAFTNVAKNPANSFPNDHQPELGYTIFDDENGTPGGGQVDLDTEIESMIQQIDQEGTGSFVNFWELNTILNRYYDGHIRPPLLPFDTANYAIRIVPAATLIARDNILDAMDDPGGLATYRAAFSLQNETLQLDMIWNENVTKRVASMNGVSVHDFYTTLVDGTARSRSPLAAAALRLQYQTPGARLNNLIENGALINRDYIFDLGMLGKPSYIFPSRTDQTILVTYYNDNDGQEDVSVVEEWKVMVSSIMMNSFGAIINVTDSTDESFITLGFEEAEAFINKPGEIYETFQLAVDGISFVGNGQERSLMVDKEDIIVGDNIWITHLHDYHSTKDIPSISFPLEKPRSLQNDNKREFEWNLLFMADELGFYHAGCKIEQDHAVFKFDTFGDKPPLFACPIFELGPTACEEGVAEAYLQCASAAKTVGVRDLIIDISGNIGGNILQLLHLLVAMVPSISDDYFDRWFDTNLNDSMTVFADIALGPITNFLANLQSTSPEEIETTINDITDSELNTILVASRAMVELCQTGNNIYCAELKELESRLVALSEILQSGNPTDARLVFFFLTGVVTAANQALINFFNPWSVSLLDGSLVQKLISAGPVDRIQGGMGVNTTQPFSAVLPAPQIPAVLAQLRAEHESVLAGFVFDHVAVVSSGVAASSSAILSTTLSQLWKNQDRSGTPTRVTTVSYGGTGSAEDASMASIPASTQTISLESNLIAAGLFGVLVKLIPSEFPGYGALLDSIVEFEKTVAIPPYFAATLPRMPVWAYYDYFMGPSPSEALPLQYIKIPPDGYIAEIFTQTSIYQSSDLGALYQATVDRYLYRPSTQSPSEPRIPTSVPSTPSSSEPTIPTSTPPTPSPSKPTIPTLAPPTRSPSEPTISTGSSSSIIRYHGWSMVVAAAAWYASCAW